MVLSDRNTDMEAEGEHCPIRWPRLARLVSNHGGVAVAAMKKLGGTVAAAAAGMGVAMCGWAVALVLIAGMGAVVFVIWWVLSNSDRSERLRNILSALQRKP